MNTEDMQEKTFNCLINEPRLKSLEENLKEMSRMMDVVNRKMDVESERNMEYMELVSKLDTVVEYMMTDRAQDREDQKEINKEMTGVLRGINENLTQLNSEVTVVKRDNEDLKIRMDKADKTKAISKIDIVELMRKAMETLITTGIIGGVIYLLSTAI